MGSTLYEGFVEIKELVFLPFQCGAGMRAFIVISEKFTVFMYHEYRLYLTFDFKLETFTAGVFDVTGFAENVCHNVW